MEVKIKLEPECSGFFPKKAHPDDAGYDLYSRIDVEMVPMSGTAVPVGFAMELPSGYEAQSRPRSGLAAKHHITVTNSPRHSGCQLSRRSKSDPLQSRQRAVHHKTRRPHRPDGDLQTARNRTARGNCSL